MKSAATILVRAGLLGCLLGLALGVSACERITLSEAQFELDTPYVPKLPGGRERLSWPNPPAAAGSPYDAEAMYTRVRRGLFYGIDPHDLEALLLSTLGKYPDGPSAEQGYALLGLCQLINKRYPEARRSLDESERLAPQGPYKQVRERLRAALAEAEGVKPPSP